MDSIVTFDIYGTDEIADDIKALLAAYPSETEIELEKVGNDFCRDVNHKFSPASHYDHGKRPLAKSWKKSKLTGALTGLTTGVEIQNTAPHFHLVENGHDGQIPESAYARYIKNRMQSKDWKKKKPNKAKKGTYRMKPIGFVPGKHYCERTRGEWNEGGRFAERVGVHVDKLLRKHDL